MSCRPAASISRSASVVPMMRPSSRISSENGALTVSQPDTGPAVVRRRGHRRHERRRAASLNAHDVARRGERRLQDDLVVTGQQVGDGHRRDAAVGAVDEDLGAGRLRLDAQAAGLGRVRELEILRDFGAGRHVDVDDARARRVRAARGCAGRPAPRSAPASGRDRCRRQTPARPAGFDCTTSVPVAGGAACWPIMKREAYDAAAGDDDERRGREDGLSVEQFQRRPLRSLAFAAASARVRCATGAGRTVNGAVQRQALQRRRLEAHAERRIGSEQLKGASGIEERRCRRGRVRASLSDRRRR